MYSIYVCDIGCLMLRETHEYWQVHVHFKRNSCIAFNNSSNCTLFLTTEIIYCSSHGCYAFQNLLLNNTVKINNSRWVIFRTVTTGWTWNTCTTIKVHMGLPYLLHFIHITLPMDGYWIFPVPLIFSNLQQHKSVLDNDHLTPNVATYTSIWDNKGLFILMKFCLSNHSSLRIHPVKWFD